MNIEVGKSYRRRDGKKEDVVDFAGGRFRAGSSFDMSWDESGRFWKNSESKFDLVAEWTEETRKEGDAECKQETPKEEKSKKSFPPTQQGNAVPESPNPSGGGNDDPWKFQQHIEGLETELETLKKERDEWKVLCRAYQVRMSDTMIELETLKKECDQKNIRIANLENGISDFRRERDALKRERDALIRYKDESEVREIKLEEERDALEANRNRWINAWEARRDECATLKAEVSRLKDGFTARENAELRFQNDALKAELSDAPAWEDKCGALEAENTALKKAVFDADHSTASIADENERLRLRIDTLEIGETERLINEQATRIKMSKLLAHVQKDILPITPLYTAISDVLKENTTIALDEYVGELRQESKVLKAENEELKEEMARLSRSYVPPDRGGECLDALDKIGMGGVEGTGNTLIDMVNEACTKLAALKAENEELKEQIRNATLYLEGKNEPR